MPKTLVTDRGFGPHAEADMPTGKYRRKKAEDIDPQAAFLNAIRFDFASTVLNRVAEDHIEKAEKEGQPYSVERGYLPHTVLPSAVTSAFSIELYLKTLLLLRRTAYKAKHDLEYLFGLLDPEDQTAVTAAYATAVQEHPEILRHREILNDPDYFDLPKTLARYKDVFDLARYSHEYESVPLDELVPLREALRSVIKSRNPGWDADGEQTGRQATYHVQ